MRGYSGRLRLLAIGASGLIFACECARAVEAEPLDGADALAMLERADYDGLDARLNALQQRFDTDAASDGDLRSSFKVFAFPGAKFTSPEVKLSAWVERYQRSYAALLARGMYYVQRGLDARGEAYAYKTSDRQLEQMDHWLALGRQDLEASLALAARPLLSHGWLIKAAMRSGPRRDVERYYRAAIAYAPRSFALRKLYMQSLQPRWGGSYEAMQAHAQDSERALGPGAHAQYLKAMILIDRGAALDQQKDLQGAHALYTEAIEAYDDSEVRCRRGGVRVQLNRWAEALADMQVAAKQTSPDSLCSDMAAWMAALRPNDPGVFEVVEAFLQSDPDHAALRARHGWGLQQRGDWSGAYREYARAAEQGDRWAQMMAGKFLFNGPGGVPVDREKGLELLKAAAERGDQDAQLSVQQALVTLGRREEAAQAGERYAALRRNRPAEEERDPERDQSALAYLRDRRIVAVALGALLMLLGVVRSRRARDDR